MKIKQLLSTIAIVLVALFTGCKEDDFNEIKGVCPLVVSTSPLNNATEVPLDKVITATFNEKMNPLTLNQSSFTVQSASAIAASSSAKMNSLTADQSSLSIQGASAITGTVTYTDSTASFTPTSALVINTVYTAKIKTSVKDMRGNALQKEYEWKFTTRNSPAPVITVTDPTNLATNVAFDRNVQVTFNQDMTALTINASSFKLMLGTTVIPGEVTYYNKVATFNPTNNLITGTYKATVTNDVESNTGVKMLKDTTWTFTTLTIPAPTVTSTDPVSLASNVPFNKTIQATFNEAMTASTINSSNFTIKLGTTLIPGVVTYLNKVATFNPTSDLATGTYTATITNNVENGLGVKMVENYVWTFTTVSLPPTIVTTDPVDGAINVAFNKTIKATFNEAMTVSTINSSNFTIKLGTIVVPGVVSYLNKVATFTPTNLLVSGRTYTATVTNDVENSAGVNMLKDTVWTFTTGSAPAPTVISTDPANLAINVAVNKTIKATFNEAMSAGTINSSNFTLKLGTIVVPGAVSYLNKIATFDPTSNLVTGTYTATITNNVENSAGVNMVEDYVWTFTTVSTPAPTIVSTDPANLAINVAFDKTIQATFNEAMIASTIKASSFTLKLGSTVVPGVVSYLNKIATFNPATNLATGTYTATITNEVQNSAGVNMVEDYVWTFTTVSLPPTVVSTDPANLAINVPFNKLIQATFNETMTALTVNSSNFTLKLGATVVPGTVSYLNKVATFTPTSNLVTGTYTATVTNDVKNSAGVNMVNDYVWTFTTVSLPPTVISTDPADLAINVPFNKMIQATFNETMTALTVNSSNFTLKLGTTVVPGTVSYLNKVATFNPTSDLVTGTYTATITNDVKNSAGINMVSDYVWTFTTVIIPAPTVVTTDPANLAINVAFDKTIQATFNEDMTTSTINEFNFTLKLGTTVVPGTVSYLNKVAYFNPTSDLVTGIYTATITSGVKNSAGVNMVNDYVWSFTTVSLPPTVISTDPADLAINVAFDKTIEATFNEAMNVLTINSFNFTLKLGTTVVPGVVSYLNKVASFNPTSDLVTGTYTATITNEVKNSAGVNMVNDYVWTFTTAPKINIKSLSRFGILAGVGVSNNAGASIIKDLDVGITPGVRSSVTGFPPATFNNGAIYASDDIAPPGTAAMLLQAKLDWDELYLDLSTASNPAPATVSGDQGGLTLAPGIYKSTSTLLIQNGDLTLDAQGDENAIWIFQVASAFTTVGGAGGNVILSGGAKADNVFWVVGSSAVIGDYTAFHGNVLALTSITMNSYSTIIGRLLAKNGAVVMTHTNKITKP